MGDDLVKRLREYAQVAHMAAAWGFAGEGYTMEKAADRIEELEAVSALDKERLRITIERAEMAEDERDALKAVLKKLEYWFDTDQEVLDAMTPDERADHMRQLQMIRDTLTS